MKGNLEFEGEFLNGKRNGQGKEYNYEGKLVYKGQFINNRRASRNLCNII